MKILAAMLALLGSSFGVAAMPAQSLTTALAQETGHSGGCRKSSPPGQCCHAGSQPLHCH